MLLPIVLELFNLTLNDMSEEEEEDGDGDNQELAEVSSSTEPLSPFEMSVVVVLFKLFCTRDDEGEGDSFAV